MKISTANDSVVERSGLSSDGAYGILFNAKMAKILSDGLYSDKVQSIIRELSCNALDSHVEAGKRDLPIEVHLPTWLEPWFHVRDFGMGLDHRQVVEIFTIYGASTKIHSDDFIGQLGLGSKSPFSYVDAYDVTAVKDGIQRQYSMYKNEQGMPSVALLGETATSEPNGVTVKMPVKREDIQRFSEKAAQVFRWFTPRPRITGTDGLVIPDHAVAFEGNGWQIHKENGYGYSSRRPVALMGRVAYPLDASSINGLTDAQRAILGLPLVIDFGIGELEVAASREALGYDDRTQKNIRDRLTAVLDDLARLFEKRMESAKTEWEARKIFGGIFGSEGGFRYEFERAFGKNGLRWGKLQIKESHVFIKMPEIWDGKVFMRSGLYYNTSRYKRVRQASNNGEMSVRCGDSSIIIFNDLDKGGLSRVNYQQEQGRWQGREIYYFDNTGGKTRDEILDMLGNPPYEVTSSMDKRPASARTKISMMRYRGGNGTKAWEPVDVDLEDGGIYVMLDHWNVVHWNGTGTTDDLDRVVDICRALGILGKDDQVYAPRGHLRKQVQASEDWRLLWNVVTEDVNARLTPSVLQAVADSSHFNQISGNTRDRGLWQSNWNLADQKGALARFVSVMKTLESVAKSASNDHLLIELARMMNGSVKSVAPSVNAEGLYKEVMHAYPMLSILLDTSHYGYESRFANRKISKIVTDYVNQCDALAASALEENVRAVIAA